MELVRVKLYFKNTRTMLVIATSFMIAFLIQLVVHELGHYFAGLLVGATGGQVYLHPFNNSQVVFSQTPGMAAEIVVGVSAIVVDMLLAVGLGLLYWPQVSVRFLPVLMWGSIAFIGEGIGMLSSLAVYPEYIEDITQLLRIGVPASLIQGVSVVFVLIGLVWMMLVVQMAGVTKNDGIIKRLLAYLCALPLYFAISVIYIKLFNSAALDMMNVRMMQLGISIVLALVMTILHKPVLLGLERLRIVKKTGASSWGDVVFLCVAAGVLFGGVFLWTFH